MWQITQKMCLYAYDGVGQEESSKKRNKSCLVMYVFLSLYKGLVRFGVADRKGLGSHSPKLSTHGKEDEWGEFSFSFPWRWFPACVRSLLRRRHHLLSY